MKAKDLSIGESKEQNKGKRGYRVEYEEMKDGKLKLKSLVLLERNGAEAPVPIGDVVNFLFAGIDSEMEKYRESEKLAEIEALKNLPKKKNAKVK